MSYDICSVVKHPPPEVFVDCSVDALSQQYGRMRSWLQSLKTMPYGHEFHKPISFLVRVIDLSNEPSGVPFTISAEAVDTSSWPPAVGGNSHQPWVMSPAGAPAVGSLATRHWRLHDLPWQFGDSLSAATGNDGSHAERAHGKRGFACRSGSGHCSYCCRASSYSSGSRVAVVAVAVAAVQL